MRRAIVLFGHGSRDPAWRRPMDAVADAIREREPDVPVTCAFLEFTAPDLPRAILDAARAGAAQVRVVPLFLGVGTHARQDLPKLMEAARESCPGVTVEVVPAVGEHPAVIRLLAQIALQQDP